MFAPLMVATVLAACCGGESGPPTPTLTGSGKTVPVELRSFEFVPEEFTFNVADVVEFQLDSKDIEHTFTVEALDIDWFIRAGGSGTKKFTFNTPGEFRLICTVLGHLEAGMEGIIRVQ